MANEYSVNKADLISIADAIREKTATADDIVFPDGFISLVNTISGLPNNITHLATGTYTFASDTIDNTAITHDLGVAPHFFMFVKQGSFSADSSKKRMIFQFYVSKSIGSYTGSLIKGYFSSTSGTTTDAVIETGSTTGFKKPDTSVFYVSGRSSNDTTYISGDTFTWICGRCNSF